MNKKLNSLVMLISIISLAFLSSCDKDDDTVTPPVVKPNLVFYGLSNTNQLISYNANATQTAIATVSITGLPGGEKIIAIDFRPATGQLYGLGNTSRLYVINHLTGAATALGTGPFTPAISGTLAGFDFNPTVDRIRMVSSSGQNLRLNPETGTVAATDAPLNPGTPGVVSVAYTNSFAGAATTTLFDLDLTAGKLYRQDPPNNGLLVEIGSLTFTPVVGNESGFDISPDNAVALANFTFGTTNSLFQIDLATGKATNLGNFPGTIIGIAIPTAPVAYTVDNSNNLQIFNLTTPGTPVSKPITGLQPAENILGIDMRPATGQLYALGSTSRIYAINMSSGVATAVGAGPFATLLVGTSFGFDFNPTVDRIRVVSNTGQNLRLNPVDGTIAATDMALNPGVPLVSAAAYTNNFAGATTTVLFDIDPSTDKLYTQNPPNNGTLVEVGALGIDVTTDNGFDIGGTSNKAYAVLTVGSTTKLYTINMTTGAATEAATFPNVTKGFAVGLGF
ncbi:MAG: DUF4394 domain-containing protein [Ferruginibacter sp.]|nr:DUF4394 domain-containing protein [Chitinophagaceae bacterium]